MSRVGLFGDRVWRFEPCRWNRHDDNDPDAVCPSVKPHLRTVHARCPLGPELEAGYASTGGARGEHVLTTVVAGFRSASLASGLLLSAASTSLNRHAVVGKVRRLNNRAVTPASILPR